MIFEHEVQAILGKMKIFEGLTDEELRSVSPYGERLEISKNRKIIKEGAAEPGLHILVSGEMEVLLSESDTARTRLSTLHLGKIECGDYVGEYSLIDHEPASASVIAKEACLIFYISCKQFNTMADTHNLIANKIYRNMLKVLVKRARSYDQELDLVL